jgi:IS30 family transposase
MHRSSVPELRRNASTRTYHLAYKASIAQWHAERRARRPKVAKLTANDRLREYVQDRLSGVVHTVDGEVVGRARPNWKGRNKPHRGDRRWVTAWSPEQIANRLKVEFPDDESMQISHEAIYQALYVQSRGALKRRAGHLPTHRTSAARSTGPQPTEGLGPRHQRGANQRTACRGRGPSRPRAVEGDLIIGLQRSAIGTLVERTTRFTMLIHLPREEGYGVIPRTKNGPALAGYGAVTMKNALADTITTLPEELRRSLTWDRGKELSAHAQFKVETGVPVFFADPNSPWQRGTNENNGLLRQYFPKGTDLARWADDEIQAVANALNSRPHKALGWKTPAEAFDEQLRLLQLTGDATSVESGQFRSDVYVRTLRNNGLIGSMGRVGACGENAAMESFFALLQKNILNRQRWLSRDELRLAIITWIDRTYHRRRRQRALGRLTPSTLRQSTRPQKRPSHASQLNSGQSPSLWQRLLIWVGPLCKATSVSRCASRDAPSTKPTRSAEPTQHAAGS